MSDCYKCHKKNSNLRCTGCLGTYYCSTTCQKDDWSVHKIVCNHAKQYITKEHRSNPSLFDKFFKEHSELANSGNIESQYLLGFSYLYRIGVDYNYDTAIKWITLSAEGGHSKAQYLLGEIYSSDIWKNVNLPLSFKWYDASAKSGLIAGMVKVVDCYSTGFGVQQDKKKAIKLLTILASSGYIPAQFCLGGRYIKGYDVEIDYVKGYKWLKKAEDAGCEKATFIIKSLCFFAVQTPYDKNVTCSRV